MGTNYGPSLLILRGGLSSAVDRIEAEMAMITKIGVIYINLLKAFRADTYLLLYTCLVSYLHLHINILRVIFHMFTLCLF